MTTLNFGAPPDNHKFSIAVSPVEPQADRMVRLAKDFIFFLFALGLVGTVLWLSVRTTLDAGASADEKKWAMSVLSAAAGGVIGWLVKR